MEVGLRPSGKPLDDPPNPKAARAAILSRPPSPLVEVIYKPNINRDVKNNGNVIFAKFSNIFLFYNALWYF